jgi:hypothetical protein|tara:strand:- start:400 stop:1104 length:705 start_codon:yes stop_codon:yes gene_type:complete
MKNILARGGVEFLAVLIGLSGSLWIDNSIKENEHKEQNKKILTRLYSNLIADSSDGVWNKNAYERAIKGSENVIKWCDTNPNYSMIDDSIEKDISAMLIGIIFVNNEEEYNALKNSGRMDLVNNEKLIINLHKYYTSLRFIKQIDKLQVDIIYNNLMPFIQNYSDELLYDRTIPKNKVYKNVPKINLFALPDIKKLRFNATQMLFWQKYSFSLYNRTIKRVTKIRKLLRQELDL